MLDIYVTPDFDKLMKKAKLDDQAIIEAASELSNGLHDGDLDMGKLFKKRIASPNQSKRDSNRSIVAVQQGNKFFFIDGWRKCDIPKKGKEIPDKLMEIYKLLGNTFLSFSDDSITQNIEIGVLREVQNG
ncbi:type II toxin-antitoxin system RelE/ParE family toxin [Shewanella sp. SM101]|jgi:hypothetical protein|uniref:type II toxin-antitoxin system RelE/ParE family toxin n=1 Tax=Shewanella TaxID=22 RepID=UPI0021D88FA3|nr:MULTISPECIES: type II toxin-antitoxin system RelE/ParE family toxin [unclassified Shewanella]MCU8009934.1 type II toxin-antitoxin system RelE/ParE family toxin [Shewanella sp. SM87]MCU8107489.1 type II toxin-antitoxin system RelE/ParE family toxin [Shewanella sp. SM101]